MGGLVVWDLSRPRSPVLRYQGYQAQFQGIRTLTFLGDEQRLVFGGLMGLGMLDVPSGEVTFAGGPAVGCLSEIKDTLVALSIDNVLFTYDIGTGAELLACSVSSKAFTSSAHEGFGVW